MRRKIVRIVALATFVLSLAPIASAAQGRRQCSNAALAGSWGYSFTATIIPSPGVALPAAAVGTYTANASGDLSGTQTSSFALGPAIGQEETLVGHIDMNPDCTGTMTVSIYDSTGVTLLRSAVWSLVVVDNGTAAFAIFRSLSLPGGPDLPIIGTASSKKLFRAAAF